MRLICLRQDLECPKEVCPAHRLDAKSVIHRQRAPSDSHIYQLRYAVVNITFSSPCCIYNYDSFSTFRDAVSARFFLGFPLSMLTTHGHYSTTIAPFRFNFSLGTSPTSPLRSKVRIQCFSIGGSLLGREHFSVGGNISPPHTRIDH